MSGTNTEDISSTVFGLSSRLPFHSPPGFTDLAALMVAEGGRTVDQILVVTYTVAAKAGHARQLNGKITPDATVNDDETNWCDEKLDVIVVGAGIAGSTAACLLAREGLDVALIERGSVPGSKNLSGGVLYALSRTSSIPTTEMSSGIRRPESLIASITPNAARSLTAKTAVGGSGSDNNCCICTYPLRGFPETGGG